MTTPYIDPEIIHTPATGTAPPASWGGVVRDNLEFLARIPGCVVDRSATMNLPNGAGTWTSVPFTAADLRDTDNYHSTTTDPEKIIIPSGLGGWYELGIYASIQQSTSGHRASRAIINGSSTIFLERNTGASGGNHLICSQRPALLNAGDSVEFQIAQNSGVTLTLNLAQAWVRFLHL